MPVTLAPAMAVPIAPGTTSTAPADQFANLLTALTMTAGAEPQPEVTLEPSLVPEPGREPVLLDPGAIAAVALPPATIPPALLPDLGPTTAPTVTAEKKTKAPEPVDAPHTSARAFAPGQLKVAGTPATDLAPGHVKVDGESAKTVAPGHRSRATTAEPALPPVEVTTPSMPVTAPVTLSDSAPVTLSDSAPVTVSDSAPVTVQVPAPSSAPPPDLSPVPVLSTEPTHTVRPAIEAAAKRLTQDGDRTSLVVRLDPPELGAVLVRMTVREGQVEVTLRAPDLAAQGGLLAQAPEIQQVLREAGLDLRSFDVSYGELSGGRSDEHRETPDRGTPRRHGSADGTVHVTDDVTDPQPAGTWL